MYTHTHTGNRQRGTVLLLGRTCRYAHTQGGRERKSGFRSPRSARAWAAASPEPTPRGFRLPRNPRPPRRVGSEQSVLRTHAFLEFHCRGWTWQTVLGFGCSRSFTDTVHGAEQKVLQELGQPADLVPHDDIALVKFVIS